jgi:hypothetical protein
VHDSGFVRGSEPAGDLNGDVEGFAQAEFRSAQGLATDEFADDVRKCRCRGPMSNSATMVG